MVFCDVSSVMEMPSDTRLINSKIELNGGARVSLGRNVLIQNTYIKLDGGDLKIADDVELNNVNYFSDRTEVIIEKAAKISSYDYKLYDGRLSIGEACVMQIGNKAVRPHVRIDQGRLSIADHNVLRCDFWIRFGGCLQIGSFNCINEYTELRCDELLCIGDFNMISYECNIWDTNTHCQYDKETRRAKTMAEYPCVGGETERPKTKPVIIGNDCWIGKRSIILKGSELKDKVIVAIGTIVSNQIIDEGRMAHPAKALVVNM